MISESPLLSVDRTEPITAMLSFIHFVDHILIHSSQHCLVLQTKWREMEMMIPDSMVS